MSDVPHFNYHICQKQNNILVEFSTHLNESLLNSFPQLDQALLHCKNSLVLKLHDIYHEFEFTISEMILDVHLPESFMDIHINDPDDFLFFQELQKEIQNLWRMTFLKRKKLNNSGIQHFQFLVRKHFDSKQYVEVRIASAGNVDAGKSTLLGVVCHEILDDGRGFARSKIFRYPHEQKSGRTSSVTSITVFFNANNHVMKINEKSNNFEVVPQNNTCTDEIAKAITFTDLAGHEKYFKTTVMGMVGNIPDYVMMIVGANMGPVGMTAEHFALAAALELPVFIVITKTDICPEEVFKETRKEISEMVRKQRRRAYIINDFTDAVTAATSFQPKICPVFLVSNVTGNNVALLKSFINLLLPRRIYDVHQSASFLIVDDVYQVPGVGTVIGGLVHQGSMKIGGNMLLGPFNKDGEFVTVVIKSFHRKRMPVSVVYAGQYVTVALKNVKRQEVKKGMVLCSSNFKPDVCYEFYANVRILHHSTTISDKYRAMVHIGVVRQTARLVSQEKDDPVIRSGQEARIKFIFEQRPEFILKDSKLVFREGKTKGYGCITEIKPLGLTVRSRKR